MPVSVRLSELSPITQAQLTDSDLFLVTDSEATSSKKLTLSDFKGYLFSGNSFGSFSDVDLSAGASDGQFLRYNASTQRWEAGDISLSSLGTLSDVDLTTTPPSEGQTLIWDASNSRFEPGTIDLGPLYGLIGEPEGDSDMGTFVSPTIPDDSTLRAIIIAMAQAIDDNKLSIDNLDIDIAPETLNSINELAAALGDDPAFLSTLQARDTQIEGQVTSLAASTATDQGVQDSRLTQLEADVLAIGQAGAPAQLDTINELAATLSKLVPLPPTTFDGMSLNVNTNAGSAKLCSGFTDRTGGTSGYSAGDSIKRNTDGSITTDKINDVGPGDSGEINVKMSQNSYTVTTTMASGTQVVDFMGLKITDNKDASLSTRDAGIPAGFYQTYDIQLIDAYLQHQTDGLHYVQYTHDTYATQKAYFYEDESTPGSPTVSCSAVSAPVNPLYSYSSGVPHYTNHVDNTFNYDVTVGNASGEMYTNNVFVTTAQTTGFTDPGDLNYGDFGGTNPPATNFLVGTTASHTVGQYPRNIHGTVSGANVFSNFTVTTPYGNDSDRPSNSLAINIMGGASTSVMDEDNIHINSLGVGSGNAYRVSGGAGDNPVPSYGVWDALSTPAAEEAIVRGGVLRHDTTNYSLNYLPVGPDFSGRPPDDQYFQVELRRSSVSQFNITYAGNVEGCWVTMPDNPAWTTSLSGTNGWADMFQAYKGSGVPTTAEPGCSFGGVMDNNGGTFTCVFGTESSSNDLENRILVRWKLSGGQSVTSMSFSS